MSLLYFNESGESVTCEAWRHRFLSPEGRSLLRDEHGGVEVETSFVGVAAAHERPPQVWLVWVRRIRDGKAAARPLAERWVADRQMAEKLHWEFVAKARKGWPESGESKEPREPRGAKP